MAARTLAVVGTSERSPHRQVGWTARVAKQERWQQRTVRVTCHDVERHLHVHKGDRRALVPLRYGRRIQNLEAVRQSTCIMGAGGGTLFRACESHTVAHHINTRHVALLGQGSAQVVHKQPLYTLE